MKEIEVKILEVNRKEVEQKLKKLGAKVVFDDTIASITFDYPTKGLFRERKLLRLRTMGPKCFLTFKDKNSQKKVKISNELEIETSDFETTAQVFEKLGFVRQEGMVKHRTSYRLGKTHVEVEQYLGKHKKVPCFIEIEAPSIRAIHSMAKKLGYTQKQCLPWNAWDVTNHYLGKKKTSK